MTAVAFATTLSLDRNYWGRVERGQQNVSFTMLSLIADALHVDPGVLINDLDEEPPGRS